MTARMNVDGAFLPSTRNSRAIIAANVFHSVGCGTGASVISAAIEAATSASPGVAPMLAGGRAPGRTAVFAIGRALGGDGESPPWGLTVVAIGLLLPVLAAGKGEESGLQAGLGRRRVADVQAVGRADAHQVAEQALGVGAVDAELVACRLDLRDAGAVSQAGPFGEPFGHRLLV